MKNTGEISPPTLADIDAMARDALTLLPNDLQRHITNVIVQVEEFPDEDVCEEMELESPFDILGLYQGTNLGDKLTENSGATPPLVFLYRRPILDYWCETGEDLRHVVRHVLIHEIGHHFGFSDEVMEEIEQAAAAEEKARAKR